MLEKIRRNTLIRLRFGPSPTGNLHIGTLRTALFNWLYTRSKLGKFILRIEDTDLLRSKPEYEQNIKEGLEWLGLNCDEGPEEAGDFGPYRQTDRIKEGYYKRALEELLEKKKAYYCFCTVSDLNGERESSKSAGKPYVYSRKCCALTPEDVKSRLSENIPYTLRFKMPENNSLLFKDIIRDDIKFDCTLVSDFVIMKSDGSPSYNFACVVDDKDMKITHVVRGEDHISNMPKQLAIFEALGSPAPEYAHMPMILGTDRSKLSKRHGATSVTEYRDQGFLKEAFINYLSLLGWSPNDEQEIFSLDEIISQFGLDRVSKSGAIFDIKKLTWMNGQYIRKCSPEDLFERAWPFVTDTLKSKLTTLYSAEDLVKIVNSVKDNLDTLADVSSYIEVYANTEDEYLDKLSNFEFSESDKSVILHFSDFLATSSDLNKVSVDQALDSILEKTGLGKGKVFRPLRIASSAEKSGPHVSELLAILGKEKLQNRLSGLLK
ncbi:glutamate--tRNA ligase [Candidatus Marinamargulisbacteria bacterium SCGC AAA071-K20]|nr:glutamate--tRNA ligase [Candidatus Marinamargulisbacteria bacterium SCGC AAA071-K20]